MERLEKNFDRVAGIYDRLAQLVFGKNLLNARRAFLSLVPAGSQVLVMGGGSGGILPALSTQMETGEILFIEASLRMIELAQVQSIAPGVRVRFLHGTEQDIPEDYGAQVIISHFFLDLFPPTQLPVVWEKLAQHWKSPEGIWLLADFSQAEGWRYWPGKWVVWVMYRFFRWTCGIPASALPDYLSLFSGETFSLLGEKKYLHGLVRSYAWKSREIRRNSAHP